MTATRMRHAWVLTLALAPASALAAETSFGADASASSTKSSASVDADASSAPEDDATLRPTSGFQHALRVGLSMPAGVSSDGRALGDDVTRRIPVMVDIGYRASKLVYIGILGVAGVDASADDCGVAGGAPRATCTVEGWRLGAEVLLHPLDPGSLDLWLGAALGWEALQQKALIISDMDAGFGTTVKSTEQGPALDLQAGIDFPVEGKLAAGPFLGYTAGAYVDRCVERPDPNIRGCDDGDTIDEIGIHHWLTLGVRGRFGP